MESSKLSIEDLDRIAVNFEQKWTSGIALIEILKTTEQNVSSRASCFSELLAELILIDIEKRWRHRCGQMQSRFYSTPNGLISDTEPQPTLIDYLNLFPQQPVDDAIRRQLAQNELNARWTFGDIPDLGSYVKDIGNLRKPDVIVPVIRLMMANGAQTQMELIGRIMIGRQAIGEPLPPAIVEGTHQKLICAQANDITTSRNQVIVQCLAKGLVTITNPSGNRNLFIRPNTNLGPGQHRVFQLKNAIQIPLKEAAITIEMQK
jgi:hypothetical protein